MCQLAYENANKDCRAIIGPLRTATKDISEFIKACQDIGTEHYKASLLAAAVKGDPRCYNCGKPGHLRKDCLATSKGGKGNEKLPPGDCPHCGKGRHWAKECQSKFNKNGQTIQGNFQLGIHSSTLNPNRSFQNSNQYQGTQGNAQFLTFVLPLAEAQGWTWSPPMSSS